MKNEKLLVAAMFFLTATTASAQKHIEKAFDALRQSKQVNELSTNRTLEKDPDTGRMKGMSDVFKFEIVNPIAVEGIQLIADIQAAFRQDDWEAYSVSTGSGGNAENYTSLNVGEGNGGRVAIGLINGSQWIYACFLDPEDTLRQHRYAYALEWVEKDGDIRGQIVKTYAATQKFRQGRNSLRSSIYISGNQFSFDSFGSGFPFNDDGKPSETWLSEFNTYKNHFLKKPDGTAATTYATQIYKLCKAAGDLEDTEKNMVATEIVKLRKKTNDEFIQQLFDMSVERLKK